MSVQIVNDVDNVVDNFIVDKKHIPNIKTCLNKIQEIFGVKVELDNVVKITGESEKQWLKITGGKWDKQSAKEYIIGLCNPEETLIHECGRALTHDELTSIEKNTNAVIQCRSDTELVISGTQLAVTLALSAVEELVNSSHRTQESSDLNNHSVPTRNSAASERLNCTLQRALTKIGDGNSKSEDYHSMSDSVKRVILDCLSHEDVSESDLFDSDSKEVSRNCSPGNHFGGSEQHQPHHHHTSSGDASTTKTAFASSQLGGIETDGVGSFTKSDVGTSTKGKESGDKNNSEIEYLRKLGLSVGYSKEEVEKGLLLLKDSVKPADYLGILKNIKVDTDDMEVASPVWVSSNKPVARTVSDTIVIPDSSEMDSDHDNDVIFVSEHFKTPLKPIKTKPVVGGISAKEKREMEFEQQHLRDLYQKQQGSGNKPKGKKDKKASKTETGRGKRPNSPLGVKRKQTDSSDDDQTCVMEVWQPESASGSSHSQGYRPCAHDRLIPNMMDLSTQPTRPDSSERQLRYIVVDGSNVAMEHGNGKVFSCRGIEICVNYFLERGHKVTVFVPQWRKYRPSFSNTIVDQAVLDRLHSNGNLVFTPSRRIQGKTIAAYDDRYILSLAEKEDGIIVSNDQYRDLMQEKHSWAKIIEERLLMFNFVNDHFMTPEDPLGRNGPRLDEFLSKPVAKSQPVQSNCQAQLPMAAAMSRYQPHEAVIGNAPPPVSANWSREFPRTHHQDRPWRDNLHQYGGQPGVKVARQREVSVRHPKVTEQLFAELRVVFPEQDQEETIRNVLRNHSTETDLNQLTNYCMSALFL